MNVKKFTALFLLAVTLFALLSVFPAQNAEASEPEQIISWFTSGMKVNEALELSPALVSFKRNGNTLDKNENIATGDTVITVNGEYTALVVGDVTGNGGADKYGYILVKRHCMETYTLSENARICADVDKDGSIGKFDYILIKRSCMGTYTMALPKNSDGVPVFLYHHMLTDADKNTNKWKGNEITIATSEFRRHLQMIKDGGYNVVTADELVAYVRGEILLPDKSLMICFDDGYKSNTYYAAPILRNFGYKATVFSIMTFFDGTHQPWYDVDSLQHITRADLEKCNDVLDQQCHTFNNHNKLSEQSYAQVLSDLQLAQQCERNKYFAYPYGDYDAEVIRAVKDAGFLAAFTTERRNAKPGDNIYEIPRFTITSPLTDNEYKAFLAHAE